MHQSTLPNSYGLIGEWQRISDCPFSQCKSPVSECLLADYI